MRHLNVCLPFSAPAYSTDSEDSDDSDDSEGDLPPACSVDRVRHIFKSKTFRDPALEKTYNRYFRLASNI